MPGGGETPLLRRSAEDLGCGMGSSRVRATERHYKPIADYGVIGDLHTVALVGKDGSIDFMCYPEFDSPSIFAALLDYKRGGHFQISPRIQDAARRQLYLPDSNILLTRFLSESGVAELSDFMPVGTATPRQ